MAGYVQLGEVSTWYDEHGAGEPLVLLHPGGADSRAWDQNLAALAKRFRVFTPDRRGHGRTGDVPGPISFELMAADTIAFLETVVGGPAHLVGWSDGASVALVTALRRPDLASRVIVAAGVYHHEGWAPGTLELDEETTELLSSGYAEVSPDGPEHYPVVAGKLARMHETQPALTEADLAAVPNRTLVMIGDDDQVTLEHAAALYRGLPDAELAIVPGTSHGLLVEKLTLCNTMMIDFLTLDPVETFAPIRRATPAM